MMNYYTLSFCASMASSSLSQDRLIDSHSEDSSDGEVRMDYRIHI